MRPQLLQTMPANLEIRHLQKTNEYIGEIKYDGERLIITKINGQVQLWARDRDDKQNEKSRQYLELAENAKNIKEDNWILDGELCVMEGNKSIRSRVQKRSHVHNPILKQQEENPITYMAFDLIMHKRKSLDCKELMTRKELLHEFFKDNLLEMNCIREISYTENLEWLWNKTLEEQHEGIVLKRKDSVYNPGNRSWAWMKKKPLKTYQLAVLDFTSAKREISSFVTEKGNVTLPASYEYEMMIPKLKEMIPQKKVEIILESEGLSEHDKLLTPILKKIIINE